MEDKNKNNEIEEVYEVKFEQLVEGEKKPLSAANDIMEGLMDVSVSMGSTKEKIDRIVSYKVGDVIALDKPVEEALDISVNGKLIASGESMILDNKLAIRLSNVKTKEDEE
jgi:flagellar motor switch protein FliN/FliY